MHVTSSHPKYFFYQGSWLLAILFGAPKKYSWPVAVFSLYG
jgi:hypothetical protein